MKGFLHVLKGKIIHDIAINFELWHYKNNKEYCSEQGVKNMDLIKEAEELGFSQAAIMDTKNLVFVPEYRTFCEDNLCGNYDKNPACPPESGTAEEMMKQALQYEKTLVLQTMQGTDMEPKKAKLMQNKLTEQLAEKMRAEGKTDILIMTAGPYKHHSCMSAYCVDAQKMADAVGMLCWTNDGIVRYFSQILFHE